MDSGILQGVWMHGYCKVCGYRDTARSVDTGIQQGELILGYSKECAY